MSRSQDSDRIPFRRLLAVLAGMLMVWAGVAEAAFARRNPNQNWRQLETKQCLIIYPESAGQSAARLAWLSDMILPRVETLLGYAPPGKTPIVLNADTDWSNGFAQSIFRKLEFDLTCTLGKDFGPHDPSWLESLLLHEYAHLCHGMRPEGFSGVVAALFGEVRGINFIAPQWWVEGVAVYAETELSAGGRGRNAYHRMLLAANLLSDQPWSLGQLGNPPRLAYPWERVYVAGYDMLAALQSQQTDPKFLDTLSAEQSAWPFFGLGHVWTRCVGLDLHAVWEEVKHKRKESFLRIYGEKRPASPQARVITQDPKAHFSQPQWTSAGNLVALRESLAEGTQFVHVDLPSRQVQAWFTPQGIKGRYHLNAAREILTYARVVPHPVFNHQQLARLFQWSARQGEKPLAVARRCWSPDVDASGRMVAVVNAQGPTRLGIWEPGQVQPRILEGSPDAVVQSPRWSPDGRKLAAMVRRDGVQEICLVDSETGTLTALMDWDWAADDDPAWSPDNETIVFVSERSGVHQIYAYHCGSRTLRQVTDARLGAFDPSVSPDGKLLAFAEYQVDHSQQLVVVPFDPESWPTPDFFLPPRPQPETPYEFTLAPEQGQPYTAWPHLLPSLWMPMATEGREGLMPGIISAQQDPLQLHSWLGQAYIQPNDGAGYGEFVYNNDETLFGLSVDLFSMPMLGGQTFPMHTPRSLRWARKQGGSLSASFPWVWCQTSERRSYLQAYAQYTALRLQDGAAEVFPGRQYTGWEAGIGVADYQQAALDLFPRLGYSLSLNARAAWPGHAYTGKRISSGLEFYFPSPLPQHAWVGQIRGASQAGEFPTSEGWPLPLGYTLDEPQGVALTASIGYRLPLWTMDQGPDLFPLFFHALWMEGCYQWGGGWSGDLALDRLAAHAVRSVAGYVILDTQAFWFVPVSLYAGFIHTLDEPQNLVRLGLNIAWEQWITRQPQGVHWPQPDRP